MRRSTAAFSTLFAAAALLLAPAPSRAQERGDVSGRVVDARTGAPLPGAVVHVDGRPLSVTTDAEGRFRLSHVGPGTRVLQVERLGYAHAEARLEVRGDTDAGTVSLEPDPVLLEAVIATVDRFDQRRRAYPGSARVLERRHFAGWSGDAAEFVVRRAGLTSMPCRGAAASAVLQARGGSCFAVRGTGARTVIFIDEMRTVGGLDELASIPTDEIERVEVYGGGRMIRVYTRWYLERAARSGSAPLPLPLNL